VDSSGRDGVIEGTTTERLSLGANFQQLLFDDRLDIRAFQRLAHVRSALRQVVSLQCRANGADAAGERREHNHRLLRLAGNTLQSPDNPLAILDLATDQGDVSQHWQPAVRVPRAVRRRTARSREPQLRPGENRRQTFTPSVLHSQRKTGNGGADYRANQSQINTGLELYGSYQGALDLLPGTTMDLTGGYSYQQSHAEYPWYLATGLSTDLLGGNGVASARTVQNFQDIQDSRLVSFFGRVNFNYLDRDLIGASVRRDGSSRFGPDNAWGTFPAFSLGWRLSEESFMRGQDLFSDLKLRFSWAKTGNQAFANYQQYATYVLGDGQTQAQFGSTYIPTLRPSAYDPNIRWEESNSTDFGVDFSVMNQRINGSVDVYKKTNDLIFTVRWPRNEPVELPDHEHRHRTTGWSSCSARAC
jgi:iron complex outermembrane receptor protein